jgi:Skp family chaperone for outer membrane proteins
MASTLESRVTQHDKEIAAIRKLVLQGMKMLVKNQDDIRKLAAAQKETNRMLKGLIRSLERGRNGHS